MEVESSHVNYLNLINQKKYNNDLELKIITEKENEKCEYKDEEDKDEEETQVEHIENENIEDNKENEKNFNNDEAISTKTDNTIQNNITDIKLKEENKEKLEEHKQETVNNNQKERK